MINNHVNNLNQINLIVNVKWNPAFHFWKAAMRKVFLNVHCLKQKSLKMVIIFRAKSIKKIALQSLY